MNISSCDLCGTTNLDYDASICIGCVHKIVNHRVAVMKAAGITKAVSPPPVLSKCCGKPESVMPVSDLGATPLTIKCCHCGTITYTEFL